MGRGLREAIYFASANSAAVVTKIGSKPGILRAGEDADLDPMDITEISL